MTNLDFANRADIKRWKQKCEDQRRIAVKWPAFDPRMCLVEEYGWTLGPWQLRLTLEIWQKPYMWHGSAAIIEQIGLETATATEGQFKGMKYEIPQDALLARSSWHPEHEAQAMFILNGMFGDLIRAGDDSQQVQVFDGLWARHLRFKYEGEATWLKRMH